MFRRFPAVSNTGSFIGKIPVFLADFSAKRIRTVFPDFFLFANGFLMWFVSPFSFFQQLIQTLPLVFTEKAITSPQNSLEKVFNHFKKFLEKIISLEYTKDK